jgi:hypothetical protein
MDMSGRPKADRSPHHTTNDPPMTITFPSWYYNGLAVTATSTKEISYGQYVWVMSTDDGEIYDKLFLDDVMSEIREIIGY